MNITVKKILNEEMDHFYSFFSFGVNNLFPEYTPATRESILTNPRGGWTKKGFTQNLSNPYFTLLGAWNDNKIVGMLDAWYQIGGVCFLSWLMVDPSVHHQGVGTALVYELEKQVKERGYHQIFLYADERNIPFYETKLGYVNCGLMKNTWFNTDNYIFTKNLQEANEKVYLQ